MKLIKSILVAFNPEDFGSGGGGGGADGSKPSFEWDKNNSELWEWMLARVLFLRPDLSCVETSTFEDSSDAGALFLTQNKKKQYEALEQEMQGVDDEEDPDHADELMEQMDDLAEFGLSLHHRRFDIGQEEDERLAENGLQSNFQLCSEQLKDSDTCTVTITKLKGGPRKRAAKPQLPLGPVSEKTFNANESTLAEFDTWLVARVRNLTGWAEIKKFDLTILYPPEKKAKLDSILATGKNAANQGGGLYQAGFFYLDHRGSRNYANGLILSANGIDNNLDDFGGYGTKVIPITITKK